MAPAAIEPATFRFVAQHLNHSISLQSLNYRSMPSWKDFQNSQCLKNRLIQVTLDILTFLVKTIHKKKTVNIWSGTKEAIVT